MEEPFTKKKIDVTHKSGFISSIDVSIDMSWKQAGFNKQYLLTDFALVLLAIDDRWKSIRQIRKELKEPASMLEYAKVKGFVEAAAKHGWIETKKDGLKHTAYRRVTNHWNRKID